MSTTNNPEAAADIIRQKLAGLYTDEPNARQEIAEAEASEHRSKHQQYMHELSNSGKSLAEIQTAWHAYYLDLTDKEKHEVWNEFYREHDRQLIPATSHTSPTKNPLFEQPKPTTGPKVTPADMTPKPMPIEEEQPSGGRTIQHLKNQLLKNASAVRKTPAKEHLKSLGFGLACGFVALVIFLFGFFNERFIAPFITPSKDISNTPIIIDSSTAGAGPEPLLIIPKINAQLPVVYDEPTIDEDKVETALERGVVHYGTTPNPGEKGNGVIFGHSSNNIFNKGKYKFAFSLLRRMEVGDTFIVQKDSKRYVYKVTDKKVVSPSEVSVLSAQTGKVATMTLITCDPPGTSLNRLVVTGDQITPDPAANVASAAHPADQLPTILPSNSPTLWGRFWDWMSR